MGSNQEPRIKPIIASEPQKNRQDSSECFKTSCFPFTNSFKEEEREDSSIEGKSFNVYQYCDLYLNP